MQVEVTKSLKGMDAKSLDSRLTNTNPIEILKIK